VRLRPASGARVRSVSDVVADGSGEVAHSGRVRSRDAGQPAAGHAGQRRHHRIVDTPHDTDVTSDRAGGTLGDPLSRLLVLPAARGRGLARALLAQVSSWASAQQLRLMLDVVDDGGHPIAPYERLGWRLVDRRQADWVTPAGNRLPVRIYLAPQDSPPPLQPWSPPQP
jgi:GNAT superfamily N-acetyltransferase